MFRGSGDLPQILTNKKETVTRENKNGTLSPQLKGQGGIAKLTTTYGGSGTCQSPHRGFLVSELSLQSSVKPVNLLTYWGAPDSAGTGKRGWQRAPEARALSAPPPGSDLPLPGRARPSSRHREEYGLREVQSPPAAATVTWPPGLGTDTDPSVAPSLKRGRRGAADAPITWPRGRRAEEARGPAAGHGSGHAPSPRAARSRLASSPAETRVGGPPLRLTERSSVASRGSDTTTALQ